MSHKDWQRFVLHRRLVELLKLHTHRQQLARFAEFWRRLIRPN